jgi:hypothetical protein
MTRSDMTRSDMTTTIANQLPRINLANGGSMLVDRGKCPGRDSEIWTIERTGGPLKPGFGLSGDVHTSQT